MFTELLSKNFNRLQQIKREQIKKALTFINIIIKTYYNESHKPINIFKKNLTYLRLHYEYKISKFINHKLHNQRVDLFKIFEKVEKLIYRLKLSFVIIIYSIVFIAQLEFKYVISNSYKKRVNIDLSFIIKKNGNDSNMKIYEIEIFFKKKIRNKSYYLIK